MSNVSFDSGNSDRLPITPQQYEGLYGAEAVENARRRLSRRRFLRRSMFSVWGLSTTVSVAGALYMMYPRLSGQFGGIVDAGNKADFPPARPEMFKLNHAGVFYIMFAKTYIVHLDKETRYLFSGSLLENQLIEEQFVRDTDGSYWLALYQRCVHLGTTVAFRNDWVSFKCPSHGAHYQCDGEYIDGPAPRSMDRFPLSFQSERILVDTGRIIGIATPNSIPRVLPLPLVVCT
jgi:cytochrome b6-f complex iron-sulfur subunit